MRRRSLVIDVVHHLLLSMLLPHGCVQMKNSADLYHSRLSASNNFVCEQQKDQTNTAPDQKTEDPRTCGFGSWEKGLS